MSNKIITIKDLTCGYRNKTVLTNINLEIEKGTSLGIIGPNGSGKTTFLKALTRIVKPLKGDIFINQKNLKEFSYQDIARTLAVVSQIINPVSISVYEYVLMGRLPYYQKFQFFETKSDRDLVEKYLKLTDSYYLKDSLMNEISGGEAQLVQIARALCQKPSILLLDEPTAHLDIGHKIQILDLIKKLNQELNLTILMVHHDLNLASEYCDKLLLLKEGEILKIIEEVYKTPVIVKTNPLSQKPFTILITKDNLNIKGDNLN